MMNNSMKKMLSLVWCVVLIAAMALSFTGCGSNETAATAAPTAPAASEVTVLGEGATIFTVITTDLEGMETIFEVHTDATVVGDALLEVGLLEGHEAEYGLYVDAVNGIALDWDIDGKYWACYVDGEYALTGVDSIEVTAGAIYTFKPE